MVPIGMLWSTGIVLLLSLCCRPFSEAFFVRTLYPNGRTMSNNNNNNNNNSGATTAFAAVSPGNTDTDTTTTTQNVVIAGGGIIGTSVAYYLSQSQSQSQSLNQNKYRITLVDPTGDVGSCASGKAGGFLARDWRDGTVLQELQQKGFDLHQTLAREQQSLGETETPTTCCDYRRLSCVSVAVDEQQLDTDDDDDDDAQQQQQQKQRFPNKPPSKKLVDLEWVDPDVVLSDSTTANAMVHPMGDEKTIAQVHPYKLCQALWRSIEGNNACLKKGRIVRATTTADNNNNNNDNIHNNESVMGTPAIQQVELEDGTLLPADILVVACGPWTYEANRWFQNETNNNNNNNNNINNDNKDITDGPIPDITAVKCHSILVPSTKVNSQAVFFDSNGAIGEEGDLEVYPRPDGDSYVNGFANPEGVCLEPPGQELVEQDKIELLRSAMEFVQANSRNGGANGNDNDNNNGAFIESKDHTQQVCYWPETPDGLPIIGSIPELHGVYVATGHSVWGILQGPITGKALAELITTGKADCVDLTPFGLDRFDAWDDAAASYEE